MFVCNIFFISGRNLGWTTSKRKVLNMSTGVLTNYSNHSCENIVLKHTGYTKSDVVGL